MTLLRRRLICFYCGSRSAQIWNSSIHKFQCHSCEAVNYLDQKGTIIEPPAVPTPEPTRPITFRRPSTFHTQMNRKPVKFCRNCEHNQLVVNELLKEYLPEESHPRYQEYLDNLDRYRNEIEEKYPQCCSECILMVEGRMLDSAKYARSDHLRRMVERTRRMGPMQREGPLWQHFGIWLGKLGWWTSLILVLAWHVISITTTTDVLDDIVTFSSSPVDRMKECASDLYRIRQLRPACSPDLSGWIPFGLVMASITSWWHPHLATLQWRKTHYSTGATKYYTAQILSIIFRAISCYGLAAVKRLHLYFHKDTLRALHALSLFSIIMLTWIARKSLKLERRPPIQFAIDTDEILPNIARPQSLSWKPLFEKPEPIKFDINSLAPQQEPDSSFILSSTPDLREEYCEDDPMEWDYQERSNITTLHPQRSRQTIAAQPLYPLGQSPFHGKLPSAPVPPSFKLRNPDAYNPSPFRKLPFVPSPAIDTFGRKFENGALGPRDRAADQYNYNKPREADDPTERDVTDSVMSDDIQFNQNPHLVRVKQLAESSSEARTLRSGNHRIDMEIAQPRFFAPQDIQRTTGLEDMFGARSFGLRDSPIPSPRQSGGWFWARGSKQG